MREATKSPRRNRPIEDAVSFAVGHRVRIDILRLLNEGAKTPDELARIMREPLSKVGHHVKELLDGGSIEVARTEPVRGTTRHYYRAIEPAMVSEAEWLAMPDDEKQQSVGVILQTIIAEALSSFRAGKMIDDPQLGLLWRWFNVDDRGRADIAAEQARSWERFQEIEAEATARRAKSGDEATSVITASLGFVRTQTVTPQTDLTSD